MKATPMKARGISSALPAPRWPPKAAMAAVQKVAEKAPMVRSL
jgi:hypothetical protein